MSYPCPHCGSDTRYRMFSGGREWYCPACDTTGEYPAEGENLPRATLLRNGEAGVAALRAQMDQELARHAEPAGNQERREPVNEEEEGTAMKEDDNDRPRLP